MHVSDAAQVKRKIHSLPTLRHIISSFCVIKTKQTENYEPSEEAFPCQQGRRVPHPGAHDYSGSEVSEDVYLHGGEVGAVLHRTAVGLIRDGRSDCYVRLAPKNM